MTIRDHLYGPACDKMLRTLYSHSVKIDETKFVIQNNFGSNITVRIFRELKYILIRMDIYVVRISFCRLNKYGIECSYVSIHEDPNLDSFETDPWNAKYLCSHNFRLFHDVIGIVYKYLNENKLLKKLNNGAAK